MEKTRYYGVRLAWIALVIFVATMAWQQIDWREKRTWIGADGVAFQIVWPTTRPDDAMAQFELGRALANPAVRAHEKQNFLSTPYDPAAPVEVDPRFIDPLRMSEDSYFDDFPAIASDPADPKNAWAVWISFNGLHDQLRVARYHHELGAFGVWNPVPTARGELWRPAATVDAKGRLWVFWTQREAGTFDLFGRRFDGKKWGPRQRLSTGANSDFDVKVARGSKGALHLVWQSFRNGTSDVYYRALRGDGWTEEVRLSESAANDWEPALAVDSKGVAHVVWDTYARNVYDVVGRTVGIAGELGPVMQIAASARMESRPSIAIDSQDRRWIAYDVGPVAWAKGWGFKLPKEGQPKGTRIFEWRQIEVVVFDGKERLAPKQKIGPLLDPSPRANQVFHDKPLFNEPELVVDSRDRVHLVFRKLETQGFFSQYWREYVTTMTPEGWAKPVPLPFSEGRLSMTASASKGPDGEIWLAWPRDNFPSASTFVDLPEETLIENVYTGRFAATSAIGDDLAPATAPAAKETWPHKTELQARRRIGKYRAKVGEKTYRILRGDVHRHTEFSTDLRGAPDGSMLDFYRYMLDAAHLDYGSQTDHQAGGDRHYWWWLCMKGTDLFTTKGGYTGIYGYERSISWPHGHRNVLFEDPTHTPVPFFQPGLTTPAGNNQAAWFRSHAFASEVLEQDTLYLYEELKRVGAISLPHTTASGMGFDWRYHDPEVEVGVEIFQGDRFNYEHEKAPLSPPVNYDKPNSDTPKKKGYVWNGLAKGHWLGFIASSDHLSTHISYANVWAVENTREAIFDAYRKRRVYGATDDIVLDYRMDGHWMGERFAADEMPAAAVRVIGTAPISKVVVIRDGDFVHTVAGDGASELAFQWTDPKPASGRHYYYVRVEQADGNVAWSSPIWVSLP